MITLALDASTYTGTAALLQHGRVIAEGEAAMRGRDAERLMPLVAEVLERAGARPGDIGRVVCGAGPGSFTSLRIAASIAKGFCLARGIPLHAVSSLALIVAAAPTVPGRYLATIDALRGEAYAAPFTVLADGEVVPIGDGRHAVVAQAELARHAGEHEARLVGAFGPEQHGPHARGIARLAAMLASAEAVDLAAWEPAYGRLAEAQVRWEAVHGPLRSAP